MPRSADTIAAISCRPSVVGPASTTDDAMDLAQRPRGVDLAILDIEVNGMSIVPVARELQKRGVPFVFATAFHRSVVPREFQDAPCWQKPIDLEGVVQSLARLCDAAAT